MKRIKKIKVKEPKIVIEWEEEAREEGQWNAFNLAHHDTARQEFYAALEALNTHAVAICEFPTLDIYYNRIKTIGLNVSTKNGIMGASITFERALQNSGLSMIITTPYMPSVPVVDDVCLSMDAVRAIDIVCDEALKYIDGERRQMVLPFADDVE